MRTALAEYVTASDCQDTSCAKFNVLTGILVSDAVSSGTVVTIVPPASTLGSLHHFAHTV
jgi:hypothetical protein